MGSRGERGGEANGEVLEAEQQALPGVTQGLPDILEHKHKSPPQSMQANIAHSPPIHVEDVMSM